MEESGGVRDPNEQGSSQALGAEHPDKLKNMRNLVSTYRKQGWRKEVEKLQFHVKACQGYSVRNI